MNVNTRYGHMNVENAVSLARSGFFEKYPDRNINACITNTLIVIYTNPNKVSLGNPPPRYSDEYRFPVILVKCEIGIDSIRSPLNVSNI